MVPRTRLSVKTIQIPVFHSRPTVTLASQRQRLGGSHAKFRSWNKNNPEKKKMPISRTWFFQPAITTKPTFFLLCVCVGPTRRPFYFFLSMKNVFVKIPIQNISTRLAIFPLCFPPHGYKFTCHLLSTVLLIIFCLNYFLSLSALGSWPTLKWITKPSKRPVKVKKFVSKLAPRLATALNFMDVISTTRICWFPR